MNAPRLPRYIVPVWLCLLSVIQALLLVAAIVHGQVFAGNRLGEIWSTYILLALGVVSALVVASAVQTSPRLSARAPFFLAACGLLGLLVSQLYSDSLGEDWSALIAWLASAAALFVILRRDSLTGIAALALFIAIFFQGVAAISDLLDDGLLSQSSTARLHLAVIFLLPAAMVAYHAGFQYLLLIKWHQRSADWRPHGAGGKLSIFDDFYRLWQRALPKRLKHLFMIAWYNLIARLDTSGDVLFMNHGFAPRPGTETLPLPPGLERFRYPIQLYDLIASKVEWKGAHALEVSSGLGGGAHWLMQKYSPSTLTGLDIAKQSVLMCQRRYGETRLRFEVGNAEAMPFPDECFDIVINVESSLNYADMAAFLREVERVLRPGGYFLFADYRTGSKITKLRAAFARMPLELLMWEDVTEGILRGLEHEAARKIALIRQLTPRFLEKTMLRFAGVGPDETNEHYQFLQREKVYVAAILRKPAR